MYTPGTCNIVENTRGFVCPRSVKKTYLHFSLLVHVTKAFHPALSKVRVPTRVGVTASGSSTRCVDLTAISTERVRARAPVNQGPRPFACRHNSASWERRAKKKLTVRELRFRSFGDVTDGRGWRPLITNVARRVLLRPCTIIVSPCVYKLQARAVGECSGWCVKLFQKFGKGAWNNVSRDILGGVSF